MYCILHVICTWVAVTLIRNTIGFLCHFIPFSWKTKLINSLIMYQQCGWIVRTSDYAICVDQWQLMRRLRGLSSIATPLLIVARFSQIFLVRMDDLQKEGHWKPTPWLSIWFHSDALSLTDRCNMLHSHPRTAWSASWSGWWPLGTSKEWLWIRSGTIAIFCL